MLTIDSTNLASPLTKNYDFFSECMELMLSIPKVNTFLGNPFPRDHTVSSSKGIPLPLNLVFIKSFVKKFISNSKICNVTVRF